jgi:hypothetical protein
MPTDAAVGRLGSRLVALGAKRQNNKGAQGGLAQLIKIIKKKTKEGFVGRWSGVVSP